MPISGCCWGGTCSRRALQRLQLGSGHQAGSDTVLRRSLWSVARSEACEQLLAPEGTCHQLSGEKLRLFTVSVRDFCCVFSSVPVAGGVPRHSECLSTKGIRKLLLSVLGLSTVAEGAEGSAGCLSPAVLHPAAGHQDLQTGPALHRATKCFGCSEICCKSMLGSPCLMAGTQVLFGTSPLRPGVKIGKSRLLSFSLWIFRYVL